ncbi:unnamed protein product [Auanema sp. JU1783]|nr:unnamed protein product [Auanema sp. JU1783]
MSGLYEKSRLFGGQAVGQAFRALQEQIGFDLMPCTIHYKFIAPGTLNAYGWKRDFDEGKIDVDLDYEVVQLENDNYRTLTRQNGKLIGSAFVSINSNEDIIEKLELDYVEKPNDLLSVDQLLKNMGFNENSNTLKYLNSNIFELKLVEWSRVAKQKNIHRNLVWIRLYPDCHEHVKSSHGAQLALTLSDYFIILVAEDIYNESGYRAPQAASLHHSVKLHKRNFDINPYGWMLYRVEAEIISNHRAILKAHIYNEDFDLIASITQEAYIVSEAKKSRI